MSIFLNLLQLGFHGFAFALFFLSFKRFGDISRVQIPIGLPIEEVEKRILRTQMLLKTLKFFMLLSLIFFILGVGAQVLSKNIRQNITVFITPNQKFFNRLNVAEDCYPYIKKKGEEIMVKSDDGHYYFEVIDNDLITVSMDDLVAYYSRLSLENTGSALRIVGE